MRRNQRKRREQTIAVSVGAAGFGCVIVAIAWVDPRWGLAALGLVLIGAAYIALRSE